MGFLEYGISSDADRICLTPHAAYPNAPESKRLRNGCVNECEMGSLFMLLSDRQKLSHAMPDEC